MSATHQLSNATGIIVREPARGALLAAGATVPTDGTDGYAPGCLFIHFDATSGDLWYRNDGTRDSCDFNAVYAGGGAVALTDADADISVVNASRIHVIPDVSADRTFTLPTPANGLVYEFIPKLAAADGHDWIFDTGSDTNYFLGGVLHEDSDANAAGDEVVLVAPDGNSNSKLQVNLPEPGTRILFVCDGTLWTVSGIVVSTTAPTFADQV